MSDVHDDSKTLLGFWIYILTDFIMFATIFATYIVLRYSSMGSFPEQNLPFTLVQTLLLLFSSFTSGLAGVALQNHDKKKTLLLFGLTFLLGLGFMIMEMTELTHLVQSGYAWHTNATLSAFFTLVGTHAVHMIFALLWIGVLLPPVWLYGLTAVSIKRLSCLKMFWQFLNVVWIFIFTLVYLMGALS
jgi:cytochrome o ubiquinol oxidase subunit 3